MEIEMCVKVWGDLYLPLMGDVTEWAEEASDRDPQGISLRKVSVQMMGKGLSSKQDLLERIIHWLNSQRGSAV